MDAQMVGIILALIGVLKGKDLWDYLKSRTDSKAKSDNKVIDIYEKRIADLELEVKELKQKHEELINRMQTKIIKSRGTKHKKPIE